MTAPSRRRRLVARLGRSAVRAVARTPARRLLETEAVRRLRIAGGREMPATAVADVAAGLSGAGIPFWLVGGWGVDALAGRQTRRHGDLDVLVDEAAPDLRRRAEQAMAGLGLDLVAEERSLAPLSTIWVFTDGVGRTVDLLAADLRAMPFVLPGALTSGSVSGTCVPCVSAEAQRWLRAGYPHRGSDRADLEVLGELAR